MIKWLKRKKVDDLPEDKVDAPTVDSKPADEILLPEQKGFFSRFKRGLSKTRQQLGGGIGRLLLGKKEISEDLLEEIETLLISADLGIEATANVINCLSEKLSRKQLANGDEIYAALKTKLQDVLNQNSASFAPENSDKSPFVILMTGINGAGKTTTIGKLAKQYQLTGKKVMLAAGDTFRAAAVEQLQVWGERNKIPVIAQHSGADSASVIYDAFQAAKARGVDVLIADTAGRLHTQTNLMDELKKIKRVIKKLDPAAPHETMLVLDASIGQNALNQARQFHKAIELTGITMTKLDGTARGGILFAIADELELPFRYIGIGEGIDDLRPFNAEQFVDAIFNDDKI